jgi:hypothetical protein
MPVAWKEAVVRLSLAMNLPHSIIANLTVTKYVIQVEGAFCCRGVFLACLLYHEDKVLVTNEDFLPVIEVDETYPSCIYHDFHWLMKVQSVSL